MEAAGHAPKALPVDLREAADDAEALLEATGLAAFTYRVDSDCSAYQPNA
jgi:hypothetical protein